MSISVIFVVAMFLLGVIVGSFINVLVLRLRTGRSIVHGRSACLSCGKTLTSLDLMPIVSFLLQRGRCRYCSARLSWQYPIVEFLTGTAFFGVSLFYMKYILVDGVFNFYPYVFEALLDCVFWALLIAIATYDFRHKIIPDEFSYTFIALSGVSIFMYGEGATFFHLPTIMTVMSGPILALPFAILWFFSRGRWIGFGDAKLAWGLGWFLTFRVALSAIILGFWIGAIVGLLLIALSRMRRISGTVGMKSELPLGPFLIIGAALAYFFNIDALVLFS